MHHTARRQPGSHLDTPALELRWREVLIGSKASSSSSTIMQIKLDGFGPPAGSTSLAANATQSRARLPKTHQVHPQSSEVFDLKPTRHRSGQRRFCGVIID